MDYRAVFIYSSLINGFFMLSLAALKNGAPKKHDLAAVPVLVLTNIIFVISWLLYSYSLNKGNVSVVSSITSLNPALTSMLGIIFYKEKLSLRQASGAIVLFIGLVLISI